MARFTKVLGQTLIVLGIYQDCFPSRRGSPLLSYDFTMTCLEFLILFLCVSQAVLMTSYDPYDFQMTFL